jgi:hypothetical protein
LDGCCEIVITKPYLGTILHGRIVCVPRSINGAQALIHLLWVVGVGVWQLVAMASVVKDEGVTRLTPPSNLHDRTADVLLRALLVPELRDAGRAALVGEVGDEVEGEPGVKRTVTVRWRPGPGLAIAGIVDASDEDVHIACQGNRSCVICHKLSAARYLLLLRSGLCLLINGLRRLIHGLLHWLVDVLCLINGLLHHHSLWLLHHKRLLLNYLLLHHHWLCLHHVLWL